MNDVRSGLARRARAEIASRFIEPRSGIVLDYVQPGGVIDLPSAAELDAGKPNALAWWTPGENGAFFTGLHLLAATRAGEEETARRAAASLVRLASVGSRPGFVARMVGHDLYSHPMFGSDDQTFPAVFGLWTYARSMLPTPEERHRIEQLVLGIIESIHRFAWSLPADGDGSLGFRGSFAPGSFTAAARLLALIRIAEQISGRGEWNDLYSALLAEQPAESVGPTRRELLSRGCAYGPLGSPKLYPHQPPFWTSGTAQLALRMLWEHETDGALADDLAAGLRENAERALPHVQLLRWETGFRRLTFDADWRRLLPLWEPQDTAAEAVRVGEAQSVRWENDSPRKAVEDMFVREPSWAALISSLSPDGSHGARLDEILAQVGGFDMSETWTSGFLPLALLDAPLDSHATERDR